MPAFLLLFSGITKFFTEVFGRFITQKLIHSASTLVGLGILIMGAHAALDSLVKGLVIQFPPEYTSLLSAFIPDNTMACISTVIAARFIKAGFDFKLKIAEMSQRGS